MFPRTLSHEATLPVKRSGIGIKIGDALFATPKREASGGPEGKKQHKKRKLRDPEHVQEERKADEMPVFKGPLTFSRLSVGSVLLGVVQDLNDLDMVVELPNGLRGFVSLREVSDSLTATIDAFIAASDDDEDEKAELVLEQSIPDLFEMYSAGDFVRVVVTALHRHEKGNRIELSMKPSLVNKLDDELMLKLSVGTCISAAVVSDEDHGFELDIGIEGWKGFIKSGNGVGPYGTGQTITAFVDWVKPEIRRVGLSLSPKTSVKTASDLACLSPGSLVSGVRVVDVDTEKGVTLGFCHGFRGFVDLSHIEDFEDNRNLQARILSLDLCSKTVSLSLLTHVIDFQPKDFFGARVGAIIEEAKITQLDEVTGLVLTTDFGTAFAHISELRDAKIKKLSGAFEVGQICKCRIIALDNIDGILKVSLKPSVLARPFFSIEDIKSGMRVSGTVKNLKVDGVVVDLGVPIKAYCPASHLTDNKNIILNLGKRFKVGQQLKFRVLKVDIKKRLVLLTAKSSLVSSTHPSLTRELLFGDAEGQVTSEMISAAHQNQLYHGFVSAIKEDRVFINFYDDVFAVISRPELFLSGFSDNLDEAFYLGQVLKVKILYAKAKVSAAGNFPFTLFASLRVSTQSTDQVSIGSIVSGQIVKLSESLALVKLDNGEVAELSREHVSDFPQFFDLGNLKESSKISDLLVLGKRPDSTLLISRKPLLSLLAERVPSSFESVNTGEVLVGVLQHFTEHGAIIQFKNGFRGFCSMRDSSVFSLGQTVCVKVRTADPASNKLFLTLADLKSLDSQAKNYPVTTSFFQSLAELDKNVLSLASGKVKLGKTLSGKVSQVFDAGFALVECKDVSGFAILSDRIVPGDQVSVEAAGSIDGSQLFKISACAVDENSTDFVETELLTDGLGMWASLNVHGNRGAIHISQMIEPGKVEVGSSPFASFLNQIVRVRQMTSEANSFSMRQDEHALPDFTRSCSDLSELTGLELIGFVQSFKVFPRGEIVANICISPKVNGRLVLTGCPVSVLQELNLISVDTSCNRVKLNESSGIALKVRVDSSKGDRFLLSLVDVPVAEQGSVVLGQVISVSRDSNYPGFDVCIGQNRAGRVHITDVSDVIQENILEKFSTGDLVCVYVLSHNDKRSDLSLRESRVFGASGAPLEIENTHDPRISDLGIVQGYVKSCAAKSGILVYLGRHVNGRILFKNSSDSFVENPGDMFSFGSPIYQARVLSVNESLHQPQLSLKSSQIKEMKPISELSPGTLVTGTVKSVTAFGVFIALEDFNSVALCHRSQVSDNKDADFSSHYQAGDRVKAVVVSVDLEQKRVQVGLRQSLLDAHADAMQIDEKEIDRPLPTPTESQPKVDVEESEAPSTTFDWFADETVCSDTGNAVHVEQEKEEQSQGKSARRRSTAKKTRAEELRVSQKERELADSSKLPETEEDFERAVLADPNSSGTWIRFIAFFVHLQEFDKARRVGQRALQVINQRQDQERFNVWIALLNLEAMHGTEETFESRFAEAVQRTEPKKLYLQVITVLELLENHKMTVKYLKDMCKKFSQSCQVWVKTCEYHFTQKQFDEARASLKRALAVLPQRKHAKMTSKFAVLEFKVGSPDRGRTLLDGILDRYPRRVDIWSIYLDQEIKLRDFDRTRQLFERSIHQSLSSKKIKFFFKRYLQFEKEHGTPEGVEHVKQAARAYVESKSEQ